MKYSLIKKLSTTFSTPVMAMGNLELTPQTNSTFRPLADITIPSLLSGAISLALIVVFVTFFFIPMLGGLKWITSSGDDKKLAAAKAQITHALVGLIIILSVWAILNLIQTIFGIDLLSKGLSLPSLNQNSVTPSATPSVDPEKLYSR